MMIAAFSPFFNALFGSDFSEKDKDVVDLDVEYIIMYEILCVLHHHDRNYGSKSHSLYDAQMLSDMYIAADKYDIPLIRQLVAQQLREVGPREAYEISLDLDLTNERLHYLSRLTKTDILGILNSSMADRLMPVGDLRTMMVKLNVNGISQKPQTYSTINEIDQSCEKCLIPFDFNGPWKTANAVLRTTDAEEKCLHVNKSVMATFSPFFQTLFFGDTCDKMQDVVDLDIEHGILLEILRILHHAKRNFGVKNHFIYKAEMISKMYRAAEKLEIEVVNQLCRQQLMDVPPAEAFKVAIELDLTNEREKIFKKMSSVDLRSYLSANQYSDNKVFSPKEMTEFARKMGTIVN